MARGSLIKGPLQTASEHLIKFSPQINETQCLRLRETISEATKTVRH